MVVSPTWDTKLHATNVLHGILAGEIWALPRRLLLHDMQEAAQNEGKSEVNVRNSAQRLRRSGNAKGKRVVARFAPIYRPCSANDSIRCYSKKGESGAT